MPMRGPLSFPVCPVRGVAVHIGSQLTDLAPLETAFTRIGALIADLRAAGHDIVTADLGGGLGVPYDPTLPCRRAPPLMARWLRNHRRLGRRG